ncbi:hypothetical protein CR203_10935 [Salipaludibacillus neizhouensis]|uniref:FIMAH domain-containing protein n=1 Tax=Salipaludibacillus neizhouensis TaxID=885475 RepID=A0A3A9K2V6_9BACI|nr:hypothetical protein [Salipaludibacillus neizhouensis]RKL67027.1 hypothetical protein CR203_10935 [Salipaludibacillus neizhouensis]
MTGVEPGVTRVIVRDRNGTSKELAVRVLDDKNSDYIHGWGPSLAGAYSGNWRTINESSVTSRVEYSPEWKEIYREGVVKGDFSVAADIEWVNQGNEGFPKYGITMTDEIGTTVSAFFNKDIDQLETFAKEGNNDLGWEGVQLPTGTNLREPQTLKVEKYEDTFTFSFNDQEMYERTVEMTGDISVGVINENTEAKFINYTIYNGSVSENPVTIESLRSLIHYYNESDELRSPLLNQLKNRLNRVEIHFENDRMTQAIRHMEDFLKHQNKSPMQGYISESAKEDLEAKVKELLKMWSGDQE